MNRKDKHFISLLLVCVIILNTLYGSRKRTEGFIKATVEGVLNIIPIKPIRKFLQKEVKKGKGGFDVLLSLSFVVYVLSGTRSNK